MLSSRSLAPAKPACSARRAFGAATPFSRTSRPVHIVRVANVDAAGFEEQVLKSDKPVLVDFWAAWCGPCKLVAPLMDWAEKEYNGKIKVVKVEHDANPELIAKYKVYGLPTLMLFAGGQQVAGSHKEGAVTRAMLEAYLKQNGIDK